MVGYCQENIFQIAFLVTFTLIHTEREVFFYSYSKKNALFEKVTFFSKLEIIISL